MQGKDEGLPGSGEGQGPRRGEAPRIEGAKNKSAQQAGKATRHRRRAKKEVQRRGQPGMESGDTGGPAGLGVLLQ